MIQIKGLRKSAKRQKTNYKNNRSRNEELEKFVMQSLKK